MFAIAYNKAFTLVCGWPNGNDNISKGKLHTSPVETGTSEIPKTISKILQCRQRRIRMENNWHDITYLKLGNERRKNSYSVLNELKIFKMLREYILIWVLGLTG